MILKSRIFLSFYGDDFTGSTDVMESLALNGIRTALFLKPPTQDQVESFQLKNSIDGTGEKSIDAFGVAGVARSLRVSDMEQELRPVFEALKKIPADFFHYKVCSTFDSSPEIGSIGYAADLAYEYFPSPAVPLLVGAPFLNRFCLFGNLFARIDGITYRLDRHPTMSKHPVTPMTESDLRLHLGKQTKRPVELVDLFTLETDTAEQDSHYKKYAGNGNIVLFDTCNSQHLLAVGRLVIEHKAPGTQLLVGASGTEYALAFHLHKTGKLKKPPSPPSPGEAEAVIAMSGSCAPTTGIQIDHAIQQGFADIRLDTIKLVDPERSRAEMQRVKQAALKILENGQSVMIYSAKGPDDPVIAQTKQFLKSSGLEDMSTSQVLAADQGKILKSILDAAGIKRVVVCGGDTSGHVARELGIVALETLMPVAPGAPLCTAHSEDSRFDGMQISLKGGQNGKQKYIESVLKGVNLD